MLYTVCKWQMSHTDLVVLEPRRGMYYTCCPKCFHSSVISLYLSIEKCTNSQIWLVDTLKNQIWSDLIHLLLHCQLNRSQSSRTDTSTISILHTLLIISDLSTFTFIVSPLKPTDQLLLMVPTSLRLSSHRSLSRCRITDSLCSHFNSLSAAAFSADS